MARRAMILLQRRDDTLSERFFLPAFKDLNKITLLTPLHHIFNDAHENTHLNPMEVVYSTSYVFHK